MNGKNTRSIIQFVILLGVGILLIWLSLSGITSEQKKEIKLAFQTADYFWVLISMFVSFLSHFLRAYRWNFLLKPVGHKTNLLNATCHVLVGYFANYGIPRMGEVSRCTLAARYDNVPFEIGFGTVITERIIDFMLFLLIFLLTLALQFGELIGLADKLIFDKVKEKLVGMSGNYLNIFIVIIVLLGIVFALYKLRKKFATLLKGKLGGMIKGMLEGLTSVRKMDQPLQFIGLSILIWACYFYSLYLCFFALPGTSHLGQKECLTLLLFGTFGVIFSPGGLGAYPAIVGGILLVTYNIDPVSSFALPWLSWTSQFVLVVVLGVLSLIVLPIYNRKKNVVSRTA